jgi:hypothetical protein
MFVNTDFFTVGDEGETYGGIRLFELAKFAGVRHFIWNGLDYASKVGEEPWLLPALELIFTA